MNSKNIAIGLAAIALSIAIPQTAEAARIIGVTVTDDTAGTYPPIPAPISNIVNGSGLSSLSLNATHAVSFQTNGWSSARLGYITFNLNGLYSLDGFSFWNRNDSASPTFGLKDVLIQTSTDGTNFTNLAGAPTQFALITSGPSAPEQFSFTPVNASHVRFNLLSTYGNQGVATINEVMFRSGTATSVPEPFTIIGTIIGGTAALQLRKKLNAETDNKN